MEGKIYMRNELIELGFAQNRFQVEDEVESLLIRNARESIVWVLALQIGNQFGELMFVSKVVHGIRKCFPAYDG